MSHGLTKKVFISLAGQPNTGKTSAVEYLAREHGFTPVSPPNIIQKYAAEHDLALRERADWAHIRDLLTEKFGPDWLLKTMLEQPTRGVALDGLSTRYDYDALLPYGNMVLALVCDPEIGYRRAQARRNPLKDKLERDEYFRDLERESYNADPLRMSRQEIVDLTPKTQWIDAAQPLVDVQAELTVAVMSRMAGSHAKKLWI